jgi:hypothetical protein
MTSEKRSDRRTQIIETGTKANDADPQSPRVAQCHIKDNSRKARVGAPGNSVVSKRRAEIVTAISGGHVAVHQVFVELIPPRPYCGDDYSCGIKVLPRAQALNFRHIQFNRPNSIDWMCFDIDCADAYRSWDDANLPAPTLICVNPDNGHAHLAYLLSTPVHRFRSSARRPLEWFADIERGYRRRLGADTAFNGVILKNPLHLDWRVRWLAVRGSVTWTQPSTGATKGRLSGLTKRLVKGAM